MTMRLLFSMFLLGLAQPVLAGETAPSRHQNIERIQSAIGPGGVAVSRAEADMKLSSMTDAELRQLAGSSEAPNHVNNPLAIVLASLVLLVLVVMLVVAIVE